MTPAQWSASIRARARWLKRAAVSRPFALGRVEELPFADGCFDFLCIGDALRHAADLEAAGRECLRVLRPGGRLLVLEISCPQSAATRWLIRSYFTRILPRVLASRTKTASASARANFAKHCVGNCDIARVA